MLLSSIAIRLYRRDLITPRVMDVYSAAVILAEQSGEGKFYVRLFGDPQPLDLFVSKATLNAVEPTHLSNG